MSDENLKPLIEIAAAVAVVGIAAEILAQAKAAPATAPSSGRRSGYKLMAAKPGALRYQATDEIASAELPDKVDLRPLLTPIEDQGDTNSCVAHAVAGAYQYWFKKALNQDKTVSRLFIYYNARWRDGSQGADDGSVIQLAMEGLSTFGTCDESLWPFDPDFTLERPDDDCYKDAVANKVHDMAQLPLDLQAWKQALAEGKPIVFGCELFGSFDDCADKGGVVTMPDPNDIARAEHSGHSMCAVGYCDSENVFIVRNSWGTDWGDQGYCYIPYAYLMSSKFNDGDCWVFVPKIPLDPPREVWSNSTEPVTNGGKGVDFPIQPYTIADYAQIAVDIFENARHPFNPTMVAAYEKFAAAVGNGLWAELKSQM